MKEVGEQLLHLLWAFGPLAVLWAAGGPVRSWRYVPAFAIAAFLFALPRELVDQWPVDRPWDTTLDLAFFMIGGACGGLLAWRVKL